MRLTLSTLLSALAVSAAAAQEGNDVVIELGGGGIVRPAYEGADEYVFQPIPIVDLQYLRLPVLGEVRRGPKEGFSVGPAVRYVAERQEDDGESLEGLDDLDAAVEFGVTLGYRRDWFRGFVTLRRGVGGHEGFVGDAGLDVLVRPWAIAEISFGPRLSFADNDYTDTYFGVAPSEALTSGHDIFDPDGGLKSVGFEVSAKQALTENWSLIGSANLGRLVGDAADSPITAEGDANQFSAKFGTSYRFGFDLFD